jgi:hypothetical protein
MEKLLLAGLIPYVSETVPKAIALPHPAPAKDALPGLAI